MGHQSEAKIHFRELVGGFSPPIWKTCVYKPFRWFGRGPTTLFRGLTITMLINHLQVLRWSSKYSRGPIHPSPWPPSGDARSLGPIVTSAASRIQLRIATIRASCGVTIISNLQLEIWGKHTYTKFEICWIYPPPSNSGKWRFIGIPY